MATTIEYALLAGASYRDTRPNVNKFPIPSGWNLVSRNPQDNATGFEAAVFGNGTTIASSTNIVISFAGSYDQDIAGDIAADIGLATGLGSAQLLQAAEYYLQVKAANPAANITLTGHSLGGGLAALVGVFFGTQTVTFDQAPFANSAESGLPPDVAANLKSDLLTNKHSESELSALTNFLQLREANGGIPNSNLVSTIRVEGEFLSVFPIDLYDPIGPAATVLQHGPTDVAGTDLHAQALLTAFLQSEQSATVGGQTLAQVTYQLPGLLKMMFDANLFLHRTDTGLENFLERLIKHQAGNAFDVVTGDAMIARFNDDLWKLVHARNGTPVYRDLGKALIAFAMEKYYIETSDSSSYQQQLFHAVTGGLQFDTDDLISPTDTTGNITTTKGYAQYFSNFLDTQPLFTFDERNLIRQKIAGLHDWSVAVGTNGMTVTDTGNQGAFMLGGDGQDNFTGGTATDLLAGGYGNDILSGGTGSDTLLGGAGADVLHGDDGAGGDLLDGGTGNDTYYADDGDTIRDADGKGTIYLNGKQLTFATRQKGATVWQDSAGNTYALSGGTLQVNDPLTIEGFSNRDLGIYLDDAEDPAQLAQRPAYNPSNASLVRRWDPLVLDLDGNGRIDAIGSGASPIYFDFNGDGISEKAGWIAPQDGLLALDANANGVIDNLDELFGSNQQDGFTELAAHDSNHDGILDAQDSDFTRLRVWQDANQEGISQSGELKTLDQLNITRISLTTTPANTAVADNLVTATGSFVMNGETHLAADIQLAIDFAVTDSNPNRPLGLPPSLDVDVFSLPWLRGYGNVKSLPIAYQENPQLKQAASDLAAMRWSDILGGFEDFMAQWSGLAAAHQAHGVTRTNLTLEDKAWMLENFTGQDVNKTAIEAADFGSITPGSNRLWNTSYIDAQWSSFERRSAISFAAQVAERNWLQGVDYSLNQDRFVVTDATLLQQSLQTHLQDISDKEEAAFAAVVISRLKQDGVALDAVALKQGLTGAAYRSLFVAVLDDASARLYGETFTGAIIVDTGNDIVAYGAEKSDFLSGVDGNDVLRGFGGDDQLIGGNGSDVLDGGPDNDSLQGGSGDDTYIFGRGYGLDEISDTDFTPGNIDTLFLKPGVAPADLTVWRDSSSLFLNFNDGTDQLKILNWYNGGNGAYNLIEHIVFSDGTRWDQGAELTNRVTVRPATEGADTLLGGEFGESIAGLGGSDLLWGYGGNDTMSGGVGNDQIMGGVGNDVLDGGVGDDNLQGEQGSDVYVFGNGYGQDSVYDADSSPGNIDTIQIKAGTSPADVTLQRDATNLYLALNNGVDSLKIWNWYSTGPDGISEPYKIESVVFTDETVWSQSDVVNRVTAAPATDGEDFLYGGEGGETITGLGGDDYIRGFGGNDTLDGASGNDTLDGGAGNDVYRFGVGSGSDTVFSQDTSSGKRDVVEVVGDILPTQVTASRNGNDLMLSINDSSDQLTIRNYFLGDVINPYGIEAIRFSNGAIWGWADVTHTPIGGIATGLGYVYFSGTYTDDRLTGGTGTAYLSGFGGNDTLSGGSGNDTLVGGLGDDRYLFGRGDGADVVMTSILEEGAHDTVLFKAGVSPGDIVVRRVGSDAILKIAGAADQLILSQYFSKDVESRAYGVESVGFQDGTAWGYQTIKAKTLVGTDAADNLVGFSGDDLILGFGGSDTLDGGAGNDTLIADQLGIGSIGGVGGSDSVGSYRDVDTLWGGDGNDVLEGGPGSDFFDGGSGNDTYIFKRGDESDSISSYDPGLTKEDVVRFGADIAPEDIRLTRTIDNLTLAVSGTSDALWIYGYFDENSAKSSYGIEQIEFANGTSWRVEDVMTRLQPVGSSLNDDLRGFYIADSIQGGGGDDTLYGFGGNDVLDGGDGNDRLFGGNGSSGTDFDTVTDGDDYLQGDAGNDWLVAGSGNDVLSGGAGDDSLDGGWGNDTFMFGLGGGHDRIVDENPLPYIDVVVLSEGVTSENVSFRRGIDGFSNLTLVLSDDSRLDVREFFDAGHYSGISFSNGTSLDPASVMARAQPVGTDESETLYSVSNGDRLQGLGGNDTLLGWGLNQALEGDSGNDSLYGGSGNDTLVGGTGDDALSGGFGSDTYTFNRGDGNDTIVASGEQFGDATPGKVDSITFGAGIRPEDIELGHGVSDELVFRIKDAGETLRINGFLASPSGGLSKAAASGGGGGAVSIHIVDQALFAGGTVWDYAMLSSPTDVLIGDGNDNSLYGTESDEIISGGGGNDWIGGFGGNDVMNGDSGDDVLYGGTGNDTLCGGAGGDSYFIRLGDGHDTIADGTGSNRIIFSDDILADFVSGGRSGSSVWLVTQAGDRIGFDELGVGQYSIDTVEFSDGSTWNAETLKQKFNSLPTGILAVNGQAKAGQMLTTSSTLADAEGLGSFAYQWQSSGDGGSTWAAIAGATASSFALTAAQVGQWVRLNVSYTDLHGTAESVFSAPTATIASPNAAPVVATPVPDQSIAVGNPFAYVVPANTFSDADPGDTLSYSASQANGAALPAWLGFNATTRTLSGTPAGIDNGVLSIKLTATDGAGLTTSDVFDLTVSINTLIGTSGADTLSGTAGIDKLLGLDGNDTLNGGAGADVLVGGLGDDTYVLDNIGDIVTESANEGSDLVQSSISHTLAANVERLTLTSVSAINGTGNMLDNSLTGNGAVNTLTGLDGNDTLNGGTGADTMLGGVGNDTYVVDNIGDIVTEAANEGNDLVQTSVSYTLAANIEDLTLTGGSPISATGNALDNVLTGNSDANTLTGLDGNDTLNGGSNADTMIGGLGNDTYVVNMSGDVVTENANEGIDTVLAGVSLVLGVNVENLTLTGTAANATGNTLDNVLTGNSSTNTLAGGAGDDTYVIQNTTDVVTEAVSAGTDAILSSVTYTASANVENLTLTGSGALNATGNALANVLTGNGGANTLSGGIGADTLAGGAGNDVLDGGSDNDTYRFDFGAGADTINDSSGTDQIILGAGILASSVTRALSGGQMTLSFGGGDSLSFAEIAPGQYSIEQIVFADSTIWNAAQITLSGNASPTGDISVSGIQTQNQMLTAVTSALADADGLGVLAYQWQFSSDAGTHWNAIGGAGGSTLTLTESQVGKQVRVNVSYTDGHGTLESVFSAATATIADVNDAPTVATAITDQNATEDAAFSLAVPSGTFFDVDAGDTLTYGASKADGTALPSWLQFNASTRTFSGTPDNSNVGNLDLKVTATDSAGASVASSFTLSVANTNDTPTGGVTISGMPTQNQTLSANLSVLADADGLPGSFAYQWQSSGDGGSTWTPISGATASSFTLTAAQVGQWVRLNVGYTDGHGTAESVFSAPTATIASPNAAPVVAIPVPDQSIAVGNPFAYVVPANTFSDADPGDTLSYSASQANGAALPAWLGFNATTRTLSGTPAGIDNGVLSIKLTATDGAGLTTSDVFDLTVSINTLIGTSGADTLSGTAGIDKLLGLDGNDTLNGGAGADVLVGGLGDDTYVLDNIGDIVTESANEGSDLVQSSISHTLAANVERLTLTSVSAINGTGNMLDNSLTGNGAVNTLTGLDGNDTLNGGTGADTMLGGVGNDTYVVDNIGDIVTEAANEGNDLVQTSVSYTLAANIEDLTLTGGSPISATGNALDNVLTGNSDANTLTGLDGNDTLNGGSNADTMIGGLGNDTYVVNMSGDVVTENANEGIDTVLAGVSLVLGVNVENLTLTGTAANATGNTLDNVLTGNSSTNVLSGLDGNDTLDGGVGSDTLVGGLGNDSYRFDRGHGADVVQENDATIGNVDLASFAAGIATDQLWFRHVGNNLEASIIGTSDKLTLQNWYLGSPYHVEQFMTSDNKTLIDSRVENLVQAMAAFTAPSAGQTTLPPSYHSALDAVIAANWQ